MAMATADVQQLIMQAQSYQQHLQAIAGQKESLNVQLIEGGKALEELAKPGEGDVYKITGPVLVKVSKADAKKDIEEKKEIIMLRLKTLEKSEADLKAKMDELRAKLSKEGMS